jgi:hypothetical protein
MLKAQNAGSEQRIIPIFAVPNQHNHYMVEAGGRGKPALIS